jgi:uncharacterized membrane protein
VKLEFLLDRLRSWFLQGIALVAPLAITIAFLFWLGRSFEAFVGGLLRGLLPDNWYLPGMGLLVGLLTTLAVGLLANLFLVRWLVRLAERVLDRIPLVKSVFQGLKDVARFFSGDREKTLGRPVVVEIQGMRLVGFVTQESARLPGGLPEGAGDRIAVYLPMSYQLGGYTLYLERDRVTPLDVGTEQAMRAVLTGGSLDHKAGVRSGGKAGL